MSRVSGATHASVFALAIRLSRVSELWKRFHSAETSSRHVRVEAARGPVTRAAAGGAAAAAGGGGGGDGALVEDVVVVESAMEHHQQGDQHGGLAHGRGGVAAAEQLA